MHRGVHHFTMTTMSNGYRLSASTGIHKGDRDYQQDQVSVLSHPRVPSCILAVVADGMGGRSGGRKASDQVMLTAKQLFERFTPSKDDSRVLLKQLVEEAHVVIKLTAISSEMDPHSTVAAFLLNPNGECHWVHSGDSRIYHFHQHRLVRRTMDHSYVQTLVDKNTLTEEQARVHPQSNVLIGCLGMDANPPMGVHFISRVQAGDTLMACTDGVWHYFTAEEIGSILSDMDAREASEFLISKARSRAQGGGDNLSLVIVKLQPLPASLASDLPQLPALPSGWR